MTLSSPVLPLAPGISCLSVEQKDFFADLLFAIYIHLRIEIKVK